jgi:ATP-binding cassette subfamily C protein
MAEIKNIEVKADAKAKRRPGIAGQLAAFAKPMAGILCLAALLGSLGHIAAIMIPALGGYAILEAWQGAPPEFAPLFLAVAACALLRGLFRYTEQLCNHYIAFKLLAIIRSRVFAALRRLSPAKLEGRGKGDLIAVVTSDIELLEVFYAHTITPIAIAVAVSAATAAFIWSFHPALAVAAVCGYIFVGAFLPYVASLSGQDAALRLRQRAGALSAYYLDSLRGLPEILGMGGGRRRKAEIGRMTDGMEALQKPIKSKEGAVGAVSGFAVAAFSVYTLALASLFFRKWEIGLDGALIPFITMFSSFGPVLALSGLSTSLPATFAAGARVLSLLGEEPETYDVVGGLRPEFEGASCENLTFAYPGGEGDALKGVSAEFPKNAIVGISGRSGSGKSTLLRLLMRFWQPPRGSVRISGVDVNHVDTECLRSLEAFMTQETDIFSGTLEENIKIGKPGATREETVEAAKKAALHDFAMSLPDGYDTAIGQADGPGAGLSGGERQRVGLARAFISGAPFLLLDEPTSNLDSLSEGVILKALREDRSGRTVALVSHRRSTMGIADAVYSAESGRIS